MDAKIFSDATRLSDKDAKTLLAKVQRILAMSNFALLFTIWSNSQSVLFNTTPNLKHSGIFATSTCVAILKTVTLNFQHTITPTLSIGLDLFRLIALEWTMLCVRNENTLRGRHPFGMDHFICGEILQ